MIWYITGKPRSGKTYYAVHKLVGFAKSNRYDHIYTNIGGFKFDRFENVEKLDFEYFFDDYVSTLYAEFKKAKKTMDDYDEYIVEKVKADGYYKSVFFCDEAQEYLSNDRAHIRWIFSYQGHLGMDFYFITQALGLVHSKYKYTIESVTNSVSSSFKIFNNLLSSPFLTKTFGRFKLFKKLQENSNYGVYQVFATTKLAKSDLVNTFRLSFKPAIFDYYKSGDKITHSSPLLGRLLLIIVLITGVVLYFKYYSSRFTHQNQSSDSVKKHTSNFNKQGASHAIVPFDSIPNENTIIVPVHCRNDYCQSTYFRDLPYSLLHNYLDQTFRIVYAEDHLYSTDIYIETTAQAMKMFSSFLPDKDTDKKNKSFLQGVINED